jgi:ADP-ribose diphosphatase
LWPEYKALSCIYLARDLQESRLQGDEEWPINIVRVPLADFERLIVEGQRRDSSVIAALYLARRFLDRQNT